jgi:hypothetical protein
MGADLVAHLVAAGADPGPDHSRRRIVETRDGIAKDPVRQAAPAAVDHPHPVAARKRNRKAVGDEHEQREVVARGDVAVHFVKRV